MDVKFFEISDEEKRILLDIFGYEVNKEGLVLKKGTKEPVICPYSQDKVNFKEVAILPSNSYIIINASALTLSEYLASLPKEEGDISGSRSPK